MWGLCVSLNVFDHLGVCVWVSDSLCVSDSDFPCHVFVCSVWLSLCVWLCVWVTVCLCVTLLILFLRSPDMRRRSSERFVQIWNYKHSDTDTIKHSVKHTQTHKHGQKTQTDSNTHTVKHIHTHIDTQRDTHTHQAVILPSNGRWANKEHYLST